MVVPAELARIYASAPVDDNYIETIELSHPLFTKTYYLVSQPYPVVAKLETGVEVTYMPSPFTVQLPEQSGSGQQDMSIVIDNADLNAISEIERANVDPTLLVNLTYRVYTTSDLEGPSFIISNLTMAEIIATETTISGTASRTDVLNRPFPSVIYTINAYPGLDR